MSKADAREWKQEQKEQKEQKEQAALASSLEEELEKLRYAGCKHDNMPDPEVFARAGRLEVAAKIRKALSLLDEAYSEMNNEQ